MRLQSAIALCIAIVEVKYELARLVNEVIQPDALSLYTLMQQSGLTIIGINSSIATMRMF